MGRRISLGRRFFLILALASSGLAHGKAESSRLEKVYATSTALAVFYSMVDRSGFLEGTSHQSSTQCPVGIEGLSQDQNMKDFFYELIWLDLICAARDNRQQDFAKSLATLSRANELRFREGDFTMAYLQAESKYFPKPEEFYSVWLTYLDRPQINFAEANKFLWAALKKGWLQKAELAHLGELLIKGAKGLHSMEESRYTHQRAGVDLELWAYHDCQIQDSCIQFYRASQTQLRQVESERAIFQTLRNSDLESVFFLPGFGHTWLEFQVAMIRALPFFTEDLARRAIRSNLGGYFTKYWNWHTN